MFSLEKTKKSPEEFFIGSKKFGSRRDCAPDVRNLIWQVQSGSSRKMFSKYRGSLEFCERPLGPLRNRDVVPKVETDGINLVIVTLGISSPTGEIYGNVDKCLPQTGNLYSPSSMSLFTSPFGTLTLDKSNFFY